MQRLSILTTVIAAMAAHQSAEANLVVNGGFETVVPIPSGMPTGYGYWGYDPGQIVGPSNGITPFEGDGMLEFVATHPDAEGSSCGIWQLVDLSNYADLIQTGGAIASVSALFNRVSGDSQTDTQFALYLRIEGSSTISPDLIAGQELMTDGDPNTWEGASVDLSLPADIGAGYLAVLLLARENVYDDSVFGEEFDGHFADAVYLTVVPEPTTALLLSTATILILRHRRQRM